MRGEVLSVLGLAAAGALVAMIGRERTRTLNGRDISEEEATSSKGPSRLQGWKLIEGPTIALDPARKYAATIQLRGFEKLGGRGAILDRLQNPGEDDQGNKIAPVKWLAIDVWDEPEDVPKSFPVDPTDQGGRYWAIGVPFEARVVQRPPQIARLFSAPWHGFAVEKG